MPVVPAEDRSTKPNRVAEGFEWDGKNSNLRPRFNPREARNLSLDAFREEGVDEPSTELAVVEVNFDLHVQLAEARQHSVTARKLALLQFGGAPRIMRRGAACRLARYSDEQVNKARALRESGMTYPDISAEVGVPVHTIEAWCRGESRRCGSDAGWTRDLAVQAIQQFECKEGRRPTEDDLKRDRRLPGIETTRRLFGRWGLALEAAGMPYVPPAPKWSREGALAAFCEVATTLGRWPGHDDLRMPGSGLPSYGVLERLFSTTSLERIRQLAVDEGG